MYANIFAVIAPILFCALIGFIWARTKQPFNQEFVSQLVLWVGSPCLIIGTLSKVSVSADELANVALAVAMMLSITVLLSWLMLKLFKLPVQPFLNSLVFPNTGNMGLPLALFAFGEQGLALALAIFILVSFSHFSLGVAFLSGNSPIKGSLQSPIVYAGALAMLMILTGIHLPLWISNTVSLLGQISIPLMIFTLGISLASLKVVDIKRSAVLSCLRLLIGFGVGYAICLVLNLQGVMRGALLIQSSMPVAVFNYLLALRYQQQPQAVAGVVVLSTLMSFVLLPVLLWFVMVPQT
jgi:predicted permease